MTINGLYSFAEPFNCGIDSFEGKVVAVDGYITMYQFLTSIRNDGDYVRNTEGEPISHLIGMFNRYTTYLEHGVKPVIVFDGPAPDLKQETLDDRTERRENAIEQFEQAKEDDDTEAMEKWGPRTATVESRFLDSGQRLLDALGIPYLEAPSEADPQCAELVTNGPADYVVTTDYDVFLYETPAFLRKFGGYGCEMISRQQVLEEAELTQEELIWYRILTGTDYNDSPSGVGWVGAKDLVDEAESFDDVINLALDADDSISTVRWNATYDWIQNPDVDSHYVPNFRPVDADAVRSLLIDEFKLLDYQVENGLDGVVES